MALCSLYGPLPPLWSNPSTALCPPPWYSVLSKALCPLYSPLPPLRPSFLYITLSSLYGALSLYGPVSSLWPSVSSTGLPALPPSFSSTALCPLYCPLSPWRPSVLSTALCLLYGPLPPLRPSVLSMALCPLYGLLFPLRYMALWKQQNYLSCFVKCFAKRISSKLQGLSRSISYKWWSRSSR